MEDVMDLPVLGELDFVGHLRDLGDYLKRSVSPW